MDSPLTGPPKPSLFFFIFKLYNIVLVLPNNEYISTAKKDFNAYISELNSLYSKVKAVISTFNSYDDTIDGAKELIDEYIQKVELAESKEHVDELKVEFREAYDKLNDKKSSGCSFGVINFINLFAVISMAIFVFKKK